MGTISCAGCGIYVSTPVRLTHHRPAAPLRARSQTRSCDLVVSTAKLKRPRNGMKIESATLAPGPEQTPPPLPSNVRPPSSRLTLPGAFRAFRDRRSRSLGPYLINLFALYELFRILVWV